MVNRDNYDSFGFRIAGPLKRRIQAHVNWVKKRIEEVDSLAAFVAANPTQTAEGKLIKLVDKLEGHVDAIEESMATLLEDLNPDLAADKTKIDELLQGIWQRRLLESS